MRSRDGNKTFSRRVPAVIFLFFSLALHAGEYLISYRYIVHNAILYNESLDVSKSMQVCAGNPTESIIFTSDEDEENLSALLATHNEEFIEFIHKLGLNVVHREKTSNFQNEATTILTLRTTCFKVDFNDTFVKISALK